MTAEDRQIGARYRAHDLPTRHRNRGSMTALPEHLILGALRGEARLSGEELAGLLSARRSLDLAQAPAPLRAALISVETVRRATGLIGLLEAPRTADLTEQGQARLSGWRSLTRRLLDDPERPMTRGGPYAPEAWPGVAASWLHARVSERLLSLLREYPDVDARSPEVTMWIQGWAQAAGRHDERLRWHLSEDLHQLGFTEHQTRTLAWMAAPDDLHQQLTEDAITNPAQRVAAQLLLTGKFAHLTALAARSERPTRWREEAVLLGNRTSAFCQHQPNTTLLAALLTDIWSLPPSVPNPNLTPRHLAGGLHFTMSALALPVHLHSPTNLGSALTRLRTLHHLTSTPALLERLTMTEHLMFGPREDLRRLHALLRDEPGPWSPTWQAVQTALETP